MQSEAHSARIASLYMDEMIRHGTTTAAAYCSVHRASAEAYFAEAEKRNMLMIGGKVMMDRNAPEKLRDTPQSCYDDTKALIEKWHGKGRAHYAISPRFGITSSDAQLEMAQALVREHPDCFMQTHLSENHAEIAQTRALFPWARDYTDVYERYGLLGPKSLFGHCIHLEPREIAALAESQSVAVFCPTSNLFLGSGLFDREGLLAQGRAHRGGDGYWRRDRLFDAGDDGPGLQDFAAARTKAFSAEFVLHDDAGQCAGAGAGARIGTLEVGTDADIAVLNISATPAMRLRAETVQHAFGRAVCAADDGRRPGGGGGLYRGAGGEERAGR